MPSDLETSSAMTIALWCVLAAGLLPYLATTVAKAGAGGYDNRDPRAWLEQTQGFRRRAHNAQMNSFEAFPLFAAAVIIAHVLEAPQERVDALALIFIAARGAYIGCYLAGWHAARSAVWLIGWLCPIIIFVTAAGR
jgi:uncharacterized MAPEG superfamily protein